MPDTAPKTLSEALVALQAQLPRIPKTDEASVETKTGRSYTYRYANLATITDLLMPIMSGVGLSWSCAPTFAAAAHPSEGERFVLRYTLLHISGETVTGDYPLPVSGTPQQIGSAITYARRYALTAVTGIAPADDDDDAAAAEQAPPARKADRSNNPADAAPWTDQPAGDWQPVTPEDKPGSSNGKQHQQLGILYQQLGITERDTRLAEMTDRVGREIGSAKDLSYAEAESAIKELRVLAAKGVNQ